MLPVKDNGKSCHIHANHEIQLKLVSEFILSHAETVPDPSGVLNATRHEKE